MRLLKFEHVFTFVVIVILGFALVGAFIIGNVELIHILITAFISAFSSITTYFFTKHKPDKKDDEQ